MEIFMAAVFGALIGGVIAYVAGYCDGQRSQRRDNDVGNNRPYDGRQ